MEECGELKNERCSGRAPAPQRQGARPGWIICAALQPDYRYVESSQFIAGAEFIDERNFAGEWLCPGHKQSREFFSLRLSVRSRARHLGTDGPGVSSALFS